MDSISPAQTGAALEFVADLHEVAPADPDTRTLADPEAAADLLLAETRDRIAAVLKEHPGRPVVLLSGGVDSIFVAAVATQLGARPHALTVTTEHGTDTALAARAADALGMSHEVVTLDDTDVAALARETIDRLGTEELWEVTAAIPVLAASRAWSGTGPVLTGSGADAILGGGRTLTAPVGSVAAVVELDRAIRTETRANFTYDRLVPDFYAALLGEDAPRLIHVFQTVRFWLIAETFAPPALHGARAGVPVDKLALRVACDRLLGGDAKALAWTRKHAIQRSSGLMESLARAGRAYAAALPGAATYSNPRDEPYEAITTRLFLHLLKR